MERKTKLMIGLIIVTLLIFISLFGGTYYLFFRKDYNWHEEFELDLEYEGTTIVVDINGSGDTDDLNDALIMAKDGDTIRISPGEYNGTFFIRNRINMVGDGDGVVLRAMSSNYLLKIDQDIPGVTVSNIRFETGEDLKVDSGIWVESDEILVQDCEFEGNFLSAIDVFDSRECMVEGSTFLSNISVGVSIRDSFNILVEDCEFFNVSTGIKTDNTMRCAFVSNEFDTCGTGVHIEYGSYNVVKDNDHIASRSRDVYDEGWRTKIDEEKGTDIVEGDQSAPIDVICVPSCFLLFFVIIIIIVDMVLVTKWFMLWISKKNKEEKELREKQREKTLIKRALAGENIKKPRFDFVRYFVRFPVMIFNIIMFTLFLIITLGSVFFFLVVDLEGEKYLCCLVPLLPIPVLGTILFGMLSIATIISIIRKKKKVKKK